jgi:hypothetical protein
MVKKNSNKKRPARQVAPDSVHTSTLYHVKLLINVQRTDAGARSGDRAAYNEVFHGARQWRYAETKATVRESRVFFGGTR